MKMAPIPDEAFLSIVRAFNEGRLPPGKRVWPTLRGPQRASIDDLTAGLPDLTEEVVLRKARQLIRRGLLVGCTCSVCRPSRFVLPEFESARLP